MRSLPLIEESRLCFTAQYFQPGFKLSFSGVLARDETDMSKLTTTTPPNVTGMVGNITLQEMPVFDEAKMIKVLVLGTLFFVSLFGNLATLIQMYKMRKRKSTINTLIINLATADLLVTFFCMGAEAVWSATVQWYAGEFMCRFIKFAQVFANNLSTYVTVVISLDRCCVILYPMSRNKAPKRVRNMIMCSWCLSAFFSVPQVSLLI